MNATPNDQRRFARIGMDSAAHLFCAKRHWPTTLIDISLRGALLELPEGFEGQAGERCRIEVILSGSGIVITMEGQVAHRQGRHLGIQCERIDLESMSQLKRLVELNLGNEVLLERELAQLALG